jgi:hypothetical protein
MAILVYLAALALPVYLLHRFRPQAWYWHALAVCAAVALGFLPIPPDLQRRGFDLLLGFFIAALLCWGIGGMVMPLGHREKHA